MGFIRDTLEDVNSLFGSVKATRYRQAISITALLIIFYFLIDTHHFGDDAARLLTTSGLSILNRVELEPEIEVTDKRIRSSDRLRYAVNSRGFTKPALYSGRVEIMLCQVSGAVRIQTPAHDNGSSACQRGIALAHKEADISNGIWSDNEETEPFTVTAPGRYEIEWTIIKLGHVIGWGSKDVPTIPPDQRSTFDSASMLAPYLGTVPPARQDPSPGTPRTTVQVYYLGSMTFNQTVFESLLLRLNPLLRSIEFEFPSDSVQEIPNDQKSDDQALFDLMKVSEGSDRWLKMGITAARLPGGSLFAIDVNHNRQVISYSDEPLFSVASHPSVYKYLITTILLGSLVQASHGGSTLLFHGESRGCLFDSAADDDTMRIVMDLGYICQRDRARYRKLLSEAEYRDLTTVLPLNWLK